MPVVVYKTPIDVAKRTLSIFLSMDASETSAKLIFFGALNQMK